MNDRATRTEQAVEELNQRGMNFTQQLLGQFNWGDRTVQIYDIVTTANIVAQTVSLNVEGYKPDKNLILRQLIQKVPEHCKNEILFAICSDSKFIKMMEI